MVIFQPRCISKGTTMSKFSFPLLATLAIALSGSWQLAEAQNVKAVEASRKAGAKHADDRKTKKTAVPESVVIAELSPEQLAIANRVSLGKMPCELGAHVSIKPDVRGAGRFILELGQQKYSMVPVSTVTGAIRLEDAAAGVVWLQLGNKSMLMSQKLGKRLADACASADQLIVAKELERNPAPSLLDAPVQRQAAAQPGVPLAPEISLARGQVAN
jgi:hypothetical protein